MRRTLCSGVLLVVLGALLLATAGSATAASPTTGVSTTDAAPTVSTIGADAAAQTTDDGVVNVTREYRRIAGNDSWMEVALVLDDPEVEPGMRIYVSSFSDRVVNASATSGFTQDGSYWKVDGTASPPTLVYERPVPEEVTDVAKQHDTWHFFNNPGVPDSSDYHNGSSVDYQYENTAREGIVWRDHAFVGHYDETTRHRNDGGKIVVGVPEGVDTEVPPNRIADYLKGMDSELDSGGKTKTVTVMASGGGYAIGHNDRRLATIGPDSTVYGVINTWGHEFHHTTEEVRLASDMAWFTEGYAVYATQTYSLLTGHGGWQQQAQVNTRVENNKGTLVNQSSWEDGTTYDRGGLVLQAIDRRLRQDTNGASTMEHVLQRMHDHEGEVNKSDFVDMVFAEGADPNTIVDTNTWLTEDTHPEYEDWNRSNTEDVYNRDVAEFDVEVSDVSFASYAQTPRDDGDQSVTVEAGQTVTFEVQVTNVGDRQAWGYPVIRHGFTRVDAEARQLSPNETVTVELEHTYDTAGTEFPDIGPFAHRKDWTVDVVDSSRVPYGPAGGTPTDPDGDRLFEDVSGNGQMDLADVNELYNHRNETAMQDDAWAYDFDQDGDLDGDDVDALFEEV